MVIEAIALLAIISFLGTVRLTLKVDKIEKSHINKGFVTTPVFLKEYKLIWQALQDIHDKLKKIKV